MSCRVEMSSISRKPANNKVVRDHGFILYWEQLFNSGLGNGYKRVLDQRVIYLFRVIEVELQAFAGPDRLF
jgi:hypothetical protein